MVSTDLSFHPEAAKRFDARAQEITDTIQGLQFVRRDDTHVPDLHPAATIRPEDLIEGPKFVYELDPVGDVKGVSWVSAGLRVGWIDSAFQPINALVGSIAQIKEFREAVSTRFLLERTCEWLCDTLERRQIPGFSDFIARRSIEALRDHEIWVPLFRTYSSREFSLGDVSFRTFTKEIMDEWFSRGLAKVGDDPIVLAALNKRRSELQAILAACVSIRAEEHRAAEVARSKIQNATALLRFLSPANLNSRLSSYCTPDSGTARLLTEVFMNGGRIGSICRSAQAQQATDWVLDDSIKGRPGILENLQRLALDTSSEFCQSLHDALILYSRQTVAVEVSDKLVFTLSALESMLLRNSNEPIQKNLGERMAFLIGETAQQRKDIVKNIEEVYRIRSAFVHHGQTAQDVDTVDRFLINAWAIFSRLMDLSVKYQTKDALIAALEDRKMS